MVGERAPPSTFDPTHWELEVTGLVSHPYVIGLEEFLRLANDTVQMDIHCVTSWTRFQSRFGGLPLAAFLKRAGPARDARYVSFEAYSGRDHHTSLPLEVAREHSWLVHSFDDAPLTSEHGGPVRVVTPGRYFYKSLKWVKRVVLLEHDRLGWWEANSAYHNNAEPWSGKERFTSGSLRPGQLARFKAAPNYDKYRGRVMLGLDLRDWAPATRELSRLQLKNCDLRGVVLNAADLRNSNLSLSDLRGADLSGADLSGSDLEGANFSGADLSNADLSNCALSATRFTEGDVSARLDGARFEGVWGLTESQEAYLASSGIST